MANPKEQFDFEEIWLFNFAKLLLANLPNGFTRFEYFQNKFYTKEISQMEYVAEMEELLKNYPQLKMALNTINSLVSNVKLDVPDDLNEEWSGWEKKWTPNIEDESLIKNPTLFESHLFCCFLIITAEINSMVVEKLEVNSLKMEKMAVPVLEALPLVVRPPSPIYPPRDPIAIQNYLKLVKEVLNKNQPDENFYIKFKNVFAAYGKNKLSKVGMCQKICKLLKGHSTLLTQLIEFLPHLDYMSKNFAYCENPDMEFLNDLVEIVFAKEPSKFESFLFLTMGLDSKINNQNDFIKYIKLQLTEMPEWTIKLDNFVQNFFNERNSSYTEIDYVAEFDKLCDGHTELKLAINAIFLKDKNLKLSLPSEDWFKQEMDWTPDDPETVLRNPTVYESHLFHCFLTVMIEIKEQFDSNYERTLEIKHRIFMDKAKKIAEVGNAPPIVRPPSPTYPPTCEKLIKNYFQRVKKILNEDDQPDQRIYHKFIDILVAYRDNLDFQIGDSHLTRKLTKVGVCQEMCELLQNHQDLLLSFVEILPHIEHISINVAIYDSED